MSEPMTTRDLGVFVMEFFDDAAEHGVESEFAQATIIVRTEDGEVLQRTTGSDTEANLELLCEAILLEHQADAD